MPMLVALIVLIVIVLVLIVSALIRWSRQDEMAPRERPLQERRWWQR